METGASLDDADEIELAKKEEERDDDKPAREMPVTIEPPHVRFNAQLAIQDDVLYIYGGTFEKGDREFTFDDLYAIDLGKLDGCKEIFSRPVEDWIVSDVEMAYEILLADLNLRSLMTRTMTMTRMTRMKKTRTRKKRVSNSTHPVRERRSKMRFLRLLRLLRLRQILHRSLQRPQKTMRLRLQPLLWTTGYRILE